MNLLVAPNGYFDAMRIFTNVFKPMLLMLKQKKRGIKLVGTHPCSLLFSDKPG